MHFDAFCMPWYLWWELYGIVGVAKRAGTERCNQGMRNYRRLIVHMQQYMVQIGTVCWHVTTNAEMGRLTHNMHFSERQIQITRFAQVRHFEGPLTFPIPTRTPTGPHPVPLCLTRLQVLWLFKFKHSCASPSSLSRDNKIQ